MEGLETARQTADAEGADDTGAGAERTDSGEARQEGSRGRRRPLIYEVDLDSAQLARLDANYQYFTREFEAFSQELEALDDRMEARRRELRRAAWDSTRAVLRPDQLARYDSLLSARYSRGNRNDTTRSDGDRGNGRDRSRRPTARTAAAGPISRKNTGRVTDMTTSRIILAAALTALGGSVTGASAAAQETGQTITLERAIELALINNPQLAQSNASLINAGTTRQRAWGSFLPNVSMSSGSSLSSSQRFDQNTQRIVTGSSTSYSAGLSASYQLFQGGRKFLEMGRTATAYQEAEARLQTQRFSVLLQTRTLFLNALRQADLVSIQVASLERTQQNHSISLARFAAGEATQSDTLRTLLDVSNGRQSLLQARNQLRAAQWSLGRQVGVSGPVVPVAPEEGLDPTPLRLSEAEIIALAESASPAVRAAEAATRVAQIGVDNSRSSYLPNLSMSTRYNWANQERSFSGGSTSWGLSLSGSYTLFDGFGREASLSQANQTRRVSRLSEEDARRSVRQEVDAALRTLETQEQAIAIAEASVLVAQEDFRLVRLRYQNDNSTILDVIVSQVALEQAEVNLVAARFDYSIAKAELESIIGVEL